jgi:type II secretory pathway component PulF
MPHDRDYFLENFSMLITSGMDVFSALSVIQDGSHSQSLKKILARAKNDIDAGLPLWKTLQETHMISDHAVALIQLGEESGRLAENIRIITARQKKEKTFQSAVRSAMLYPVLIVMVACIIIAGIMWFILPHLASVFSQLKIQLPLITRILIGAGVFVRAYGSVVLPLGIAFGALAVYVLFFFPKTKHLGHALFFYIPGIHRIMQEVELSRFGSMLGTLLSAGLPIVDALHALANSASFLSYKKLYRHMASSVKDGASLKESLRAYRGNMRLIPLPIQSIIATSEQTGKLAEALITIGNAYEEKSAASSKDISLLIEPILLIIIWLGVLFVALAVVLPVYRILGGVQ